MIFLGNLTLVGGTNYQVGLVHNMPLDSMNGIKDNNGNLMTQAQLEQIGVLVDSMPNPTPPVGQQVAGTFVDKSTNTVTYSYSAIPQSQEQIITNLQAQINSLIPSTQPVANPVTISDYKENKIAQMNAAYQNAIYNTFASTAFDGKTEETYSCSAVDQSRINGEVTMAMAVKAGFSTEALSWKNVSQNQCVPWSADQIIQLGTDLHKFVTEKTDYLEVLTVYINKQTTVDAVNTVTWGMTIPATS